MSENVRKDKNLAAYKLESIERNLQILSLLLDKNRSVFGSECEQPESNQTSSKKMVSHPSFCRPFTLGRDLI